MKKIILLCVIFGWACSVLAQDNIKRPESYNYQSGIDAYNQKDYSKSMEYFDLELQNNPNNGYAMLWEAYIYRNIGQNGNAISYASKAVKNIPKKDKKWIGMCYGLQAGVLAELGDTAKALSNYDLAIKYSPETQFIFEKCNILNNQKKYNEIDNVLKQAMAINENDPVTWTYMGRNEDAKGHYNTAIEQYSYAVKLDPNYSSAYSFRATTYIKTLQYKEACMDVISALSIDGDTWAYLQLYELADKAISILIPQLKAQQLREPNEKLWSYLLGLVQARTDDYLAAEQSFREAKKISENQGQMNLLICQNLSETLNELGKYSEALVTNDTCLDIDSTDIRTWRGRADIYYNLGKIMQAIESINSAISLSPENDALYSKRFAFYMHNKMYRNALDDINTAISLNPENAYYLLQRGEIFRRLNKINDAESDYRKIIDIELAKSEEERNMENLAYAYAHLGDKERAVPIIENVYTNRINKDSEYNKACLYSLIDEKDIALKHLEQSLLLGFCEFVYIKNDTDLDNIRETTTFKRLIGEYQKKYNDGTSDADKVNDEYMEETSEVPFTKEAGIYKVKCTINDLPLHFYFDTGAADVTLSSVEALFMLKNDYLKPSDIKGKDYYSVANGDISEGTIIILRKVDFGGFVLENVKASVVHNQKAPLLLGQTVLGRLGKIEIDYHRNVLKITQRKKIEK